MKENNTANLVLQRIYNEVSQMDNINSLSFDIDYKFKEKCSSCEKAKERQNEYNTENNE